MYLMHSVASSAVCPLALSQSISLAASTAVMLCSILSTSCQIVLGSVSRPCDSIIQYMYMYFNSHIAQTYMYIDVYFVHVHVVQNMLL